MVAAVVDTVAAVVECVVGREHSGYIHHTEHHISGCNCQAVQIPDYTVHTVAAGILRTAVDTALGCIADRHRIAGIVGIAVQAGMKQHLV